MANNKKALGKGIGALLKNMEIPTPTEGDEKTMSAGIANIAIKDITLNPFQPRKEFDETLLQDLAESIKHQGIIVPITVRKQEDGYQLIAGERRLRAAKIAGLEEVPAYIRIATDSQMMEMALVENIQRENLNAIETALSFQALIDECNLTQEEMSQRIGKNRSTVTNYLRLLKLPAEIQLAIQDNRISMGHARAIINVEDPEKQINIVREVIDRGISVRQVEQMVAALKKPKHNATTKNKQPLPELHVAFKTNFSKRIGAPITITRTTRGKGSINIPFTNDEDFERVVAVILGEREQ